MTRVRTDGLGQMMRSEEDHLLTWDRTFPNEAIIVFIISAFKNVNCHQPPGNHKYQQQQVITVQTQAQRPGKTKIHFDKGGRKILYLQYIFVQIAFLIC